MQNRHEIRKKDLVTCGVESRPKCESKSKKRKRERKVAFADVMFSVKAGLGLDA